MEPGDTTPGFLHEWGMSVVLAENSDLGRFVTLRNLGRQYDFLHTAFLVSREQDGFALTQNFIKDLNIYATHFLSHHPGEYRNALQINVSITETDLVPPPWERVWQLMEGFTAHLQAHYEKADPLELAAYVLWRLNWIHPFVQGNGRTARAYSYYLLCHKLQMWLPGEPIIPEQIRARRQEYCNMLVLADKALNDTGAPDLNGLVTMLNQMLQIQLASATPASSPSPPPSS
jgi:Fic family protein